MRVQVQIAYMVEPLPRHQPLCTWVFMDLIATYPRPLDSQNSCSPDLGIPLHLDHPSHPADRKLERDLRLGER